MNRRYRRLTKKEKLSKLTRFLLVCIVIVLIYTVVEMVVSVKTGTSHDTLTTCVYAFFGTELASCTIIKVFNILKVDGGEKE